MSLNPAPWEAPRAGDTGAPSPHAGRPTSARPEVQRPGGQGRSEDQPARGAAAGGASLLQTLLFAAIIFYVWRFGAELAAAAGESVRTCEQAGGGIECLTGPGVWQYALWPLVSLIAAFSFFRGATVANGRGRGGGVLLTLLGFAALGASLIWAMG